MNHFESDPMNNRIGDAAADPSLVALADQNKSAALEMVRKADTFFVATLISTDEGHAIASCSCIKGMPHGVFFDEVAVSLAQMVEETDEELGDAA